MLCVFIEKAAIWSSVTDPSQTHTDRQTRIDNGATQLV